MASNLILLPESYPVAKLLCDYLFEEGRLDNGADLLILKKQLPGFASLVEEYSFNTLHLLDEEYYGRVSKSSTEEFIRTCLKEPYATAWFPFNTFKGNAFLFGATLAGTVKAVNASLYGSKEVPVVGFSLEEVYDRLEYSVPWKERATEVEDTRAEVATRLASVEGSIEVSGERPSFGLVEGFAHDVELFCNYALALEYATGCRVLDIGGGLGYGTYLISKVAREVVYVDKSPEAVQTIEKLWMQKATNLRALCADVTELALTEIFDTIFLMEVLEHVEEPEELLSKIRPHLKDGGVLVITTPEEELFPYAVCPPERWGEEPDELLGSALWPWHIQPLGEWALLPMLERLGFKVLRKSYLTYHRGRELARELHIARKQNNAHEVFELLNRSTLWSVDDFCVTEQRDPVFSAFFYNVAVTQV